MVLPRLAVVFDPQSVLTFRLREASADTWETVWLVDRNVAESEADTRLLRRLGRVVDVTDLDEYAVARLLEPLDVRGVLAFSDNDVLRASLIGQALAVPARTTEAAYRLTNKAAQRAAFRDAGLRTPGFRLVTLPAERRDLLRLAAEVRFPAVVKPISGSGSRNVLPVSDAEDLVRLLGSWPLYADENECPVLIEDRVADGWPRGDRPYADYVTVESFAAAGRISHIAITGRMPMADPFRQTGSFLPSNLSPNDRVSVMEAAQRAISATGATIGTFHTEVKLAPDGPVVVEVNGRMGGGGVPDMLGLVAGQSMLNLTGRVALGEPVHFEAPVFCTQVGYYYRFQPPIGAGLLTKLDGAAKVAEMPGVRELFVNRRVGARVDDWRNGSGGFVLSVLGTAPDHESLWGQLDEMRDLLHIEFDQP